MKKLNIEELFNFPKNGISFYFLLFLFPLLIQSCATEKLAEISLDRFKQNASGPSYDGDFSDKANVGFNFGLVFEKVKIERGPFGPPVYKHFREGSEDPFGNIYGRGWLGPLKTQDTIIIQIFQVVQIYIQTILTGHHSIITVTAILKKL